MDDQDTPRARTEQDARHDAPYDLIVIGAGIAGLNALHAASLYLPPTSRILLIDAKDKPGGMWTLAYDYVRLHQPHPLFTVGGQSWNWRKPPSYLATRDEVQAHLAECLKMLRSRFDVDERFGHCVSNVREVQRAGVWGAEIDVHPLDAPDQTVTLAAERVIHAAGFDYQAPDTLALSDERVLSITPANLLTTLANNPAAPIFIVGGGKTGMDTVLAVQNQNPNRLVTLINGGGTYYLNRTKFFPAGFRRWTGGALAAGIFRDCAMRFNGYNEDDARTHFITNYAVDSDQRSQNFIYGLLSEDEHKRIETGLQDKLWDYLDDVIAGETGTVMRMRSGAEIPISQGSIFVNCTGSLLRKEENETPMPCLSPHDVILSINTREAMHILTTYASFILSHLFFSGKLRDAGLYFLDLEVLLKQNKQAFSFATMTQSYHNLLMGLKNLPSPMLKHFGMDFNLWYPAPRRLLALIGIRKTAREDIQHCRASLDAVVARFNIRGGKMQ